MVPEPHRRRLLTSSGALAVAALAGCTDVDTGDTDPETPAGTDVPEPEYGHLFDYGSDYAGTVDRRGEDEVRIEVGAEQGLSFEPQAVWVDVDTTVVWEWTGDGGAHDVARLDGPAELRSALTDEAGHEYAVTLTDEGITRYTCRPHEVAGMHGALVVGPDIESSVTEYDTTPVEYGDWFADTPNVDAADPAATKTELRSDEVTVRVGGSGSLDPETNEWDTDPIYSDPALLVPVGTTVRWWWVPGAGAHSVVAEDGRFESDLVAVEAAELHDEQEEEHEFTHTFEEPGIHEYACERHRDEGMRGAVVVVESRHDRT